MDSDQLIFRYLEEKSFSKIKADYLLENHLNDSVSYLFIAKNNEWFAAVSLFEKGTQNYSKGMPKYAILKKDKIELEYSEDQRCLIEYFTALDRH